MSVDNGNRTNFASKIGLVLATAGSAVGLGNIWRFPYIAGKYGCRIEDMITILPDGTVHDFTQSPKQLIEL